MAPHATDTGEPYASTTSSQRPAIMVIASSRAVVSGRITAGTIVISMHTGKIISIFRSVLPPSDFPSGTYYVDHSPKILIPGLVDAHVHLNEPGRTEWEGFWTGTRAAAFGGVTTVVDMPLNAIPPTTTVANFKEKIDAAEGKCWVDVGFYGGIVPGNDGELKGLVKEGVRGFKGFLIDSGVEEFPAVSSQDIKKALTELSDKPTVVMFHAEMIPPITASVGDRVQTSEPPLEPTGPLSAYRTFLDSRPSSFETYAIAEILSLAHVAPNLPLHIVHLSAVEAIPMLREARAKGVKITAETCFHYLSLAAESIKEGDTRHKCCPPIRSLSNQDGLWDEMTRNDDSAIKTVVSDHSPCTPDLKLLPSTLSGDTDVKNTDGEDGNFFSAWGGISSVGLGISILWTEGEKRGINIEDVVKWCCKNTADQVGLGRRKGDLAVGLDGDIAVFDDEATFTVEPSTMLFRNKCSPYENKTLKGVVTETWLRGRKVFSREDGFAKAGPRGELLLESRKAMSETSSESTVPLRKQLKEEARKKRVKERHGLAERGHRTRADKWELTVGIEIHAELNTARKLFSSAATSANATPNTHVALFDLAFPGSQPHFQPETLIPALRAALALNCEVQRRSTFDRKHYFYQDQPAGYQITQYYEPFAKDGHIVLYDHDGIAPEEGKSITVGIKQIQMEQDTAKTLHQPPSTHLLDFNRVSHPLIEIITLPQIHHPTTAAACVRKIQSILKSVNAVTAGMEMGGLRADVNVSVRERDHDSRLSPGMSYHGVSGLGQRTEIKNLSSFKAVENAIVAERDRQIEVLESGGTVDGETRGWTLGSTQTKRLRGKEGEIDYRYMPDPDLAPVIIGEDLVEHLRATLPLLPDETIRKLIDQSKYGLTLKDAKTLVSLDDGDRLEYYMDVCDILARQLPPDDATLQRSGRMAGNYILHELGGLLSASEMSWNENPISSGDLAEILLLLLRQQINGATAKQLLAMVFNRDGRSVEQIVSDDALLLKPMSDEEYVDLAAEVLRANPKMVKAVKKDGAKGKVMWFVGEIIRKAEGSRVEADKVEEIVRELIRESS